MRALYEILEDAKNGNMPTYKECYWAMLCLEILWVWDNRELRHELLEVNRTSEFIRKLKANNSFDRGKGALGKSPKEWLGPKWDPSNQEYQKRRTISEKLFDKIMKQE